MNLKILALTCFLFCPLASLAAERYEFYNGIRAMGMGGASVATVNDETALISNPAALGKLRDYYITLIDPEVELGVETQNMIGYDLLVGLSPQRTLDKSNAHPDDHLHTRAQIFPSIVVPNFGFGVFGKYVTDAEVDTATNTFNFDYTNDYAAVAGFNFRFFNGIIKLGTNARIVNRTEVHDHTIDPLLTNLTLKALASSGVGVATDAGLILSAPIAALPTLAAVYRDIGRTSYSMRDGMFMKTTNKPDSTAETVDVAISISPILGNRIRSTWTVEYQDVLTTSKETDHMRRAHGGVEINIADAVFVRGGMNQKYWTAGLELAMMNYQFQAASYGEDIGSSGASVEDRRYEIKFSFRF